MMRYLFGVLLGILTVMTEPTFAQEETKTVVILLGPPGSGKGTQAVQVSKTLGIPHISTGDLFRYNIKNQTPLGVKVKEYLDAGKLVPDSLTLDMLFDRLKADDCKKGYLLDGVPRTVSQAETLEAYFKGFPCRLIVCNLMVSDDEVLKRITGRRSCPQCSAIYHVDANPPKVAGKCDKCGSDLIQRSDDQAEVVQERLKAYYSQTKPVEDFYKKTATVHQIDGSAGQEKVFTALMQAIRPN